MQHTCDVQHAQFWAGFVWSLCFFPKALLSNLWSPPSAASKTCSLTWILNSPQWSITHLVGLTGWTKSGESLGNGCVPWKCLVIIYQSLWLFLIWNKNHLWRSVFFRHQTEMRSQLGQAAVVSHIGILFGEDLFDPSNGNLRSLAKRQNIGTQLLNNLYRAYIYKYIFIYKYIIQLCIYIV